ncbi:MAG: hypothetical protein ACWGQW_16845, partial [bacterium]
VIGCVGKEPAGVFRGDRVSNRLCLVPGSGKYIAETKTFLRGWGAVWGVSSSSLLCCWLSS